MPAATEKPARAPAKIPRINPAVAPFVICSNRDCESVLKPQAVKGKGGCVADIVYVCTNCGYKFTLSLVPALGECKALTEEERDKLEEKKNL